MTTPETVAVYVADDNYLPHVATPIAALRHHHPDIRVAVITDSTGPLPEGVERVAPARVSPLKYTTSNPRVAHISPMSWPKLHAPGLVDADRIIMFEVDTLVLGLVDELVTGSLNGAVIGGVADRFMPTIRDARRRLGDAAPPGYRNMNDDQTYIQTGVVVVDVPRWRHRDLTTQCMEVALSWPLPELEQDAINLVCRPVRTFEPMLNYLIDYDTRTVPPGCRVLHYVGPVKPWNPDYPPSPSLDLWNSYRTGATP